MQICKYVNNIKILYNNYIMYDINHSCIYKRIEVDFANHPKYTKEEVDILCENTYRADMLKAFGLDNFYEDAINNMVITNFNLCKHDKGLAECMTLLSKDDLEFGFIIMHSYDYFYIAHACISDYLKNKKVEDHHLQMLKGVIMKLREETEENVVEKVVEKNV
jgi:hypothetical protein